MATVLGYFLFFLKFLFESLLCPVLLFDTSWLHVSPLAHDTMNGVGGNSLRGEPHTHTLSRSLFLYIFILLWEVIKNRFCWWHSKASWTDSISWPFLPPVKYLKSAIQCECQWDPFVTRQAHTHNSMLQILLVRKLNKNPPKNTDYYLMTLKNKIFLSAEINIY